MGKTHSSVAVEVAGQDADSLTERGQRNLRLAIIERLAIALRAQPSDMMPEVKP